MAEEHTRVQSSGAKTERNRKMMNNGGQQKIEIYTKNISNDDKIR